MQNRFTNRISPVESFDTEGIPYEGAASAEEDRNTRTSTKLLELSHW